MPLEMWSLVRHQLALRGSYGSCQVTGNCCPATSKTQQRAGRHVIYGDLKAARLEPAATHISIISQQQLFLVLHVVIVILTLTGFVLMYLISSQSLRVMLTLQSTYIACSCLVQHQSVTIVCLSNLSFASISVKSSCQSAIYYIQKLSILSFGLLLSRP